MKHWFFDYLFAKGGFSPENFPDLFGHTDPNNPIAIGDFVIPIYPVVYATLFFLIAAVVLYNVQTRRLHRHFPLVNMQEWLLWTSLAMFTLILVEATFKFYFFFVLLTVVLGLAAFVWIRFFKFPPEIEAYNQQLRRARFYSQQKYRHPEATVRPKRSERARRRRRR